MKLREWNARLHGLVIFRTLLEDPVIARLVDLTDRMEAGVHSMGAVCDAAAQFEAALFERTTNWGDYLSTAVLEAETVCVGRPPPGPWIRYCRLHWTASWLFCSSCAA